MKNLEKIEHLVGKSGCHRLPMVSTMGCGRHHSQIVVASAMVASLFLKRCVLMLCPERWYLAQFDRGGMFLVSFACFIYLQVLRNHSFIHTIGFKKFKYKIKTQANTKHNRKNRGIKHKIKHINPQE